LKADYTVHDCATNFTFDIVMTSWHIMRRFTEVSQRDYHTDAG